VPGSGPWWDSENHRWVCPKVQAALQDALGLVRQNAAAWHINPHKVGVMGFSAGGHLAAAISTNFAKWTYPPVDADDKLSCRPDFAESFIPGIFGSTRTRTRRRGTTVTTACAWTAASVPARHRPSGSRRRTTTSMAYRSR
jgi:acetyl esterase/lipase